MSKENLEQFMKQIDESKDLQAKIGEEITGDALVALGAAHGCEFSIEDLQGDAELSDKQLEGVAGGSPLSNSTVSVSCVSAVAVKDDPAIQSAMKKELAHTRRRTSTRSKCAFRLRIVWWTGVSGNPKRESMWRRESNPHHTFS